MTSSAGSARAVDAAGATLAVIGAGSWGTALAVLLSRNGHNVRLWGHDPAHTCQIDRARENAVHLPGVALSPQILVTADLRQAVTDATALVVAVPSFAFSDVVRSIAAIAPAVPTINATKGFESGSSRLLHEVHAELRPNAPFLVLSGPTFAVEVAAGLPTAVTLAAADPLLATSCATWFHNDYFRVYTSNDIVGVEVAGATKNVFAIAAGIAEGLRFGANGRAALITRGLAEMVRLGEAMGGQRETFMGLAGVGDLILTCTEDKSRNRRFGLAVGRGDPIGDTLKKIGQVVEGAAAARELARLAQRLNVPMPIVEQVHAVIYDKRDPREAVRNLLQRAPAAEWRDA